MQKMPSNEETIVRALLEQALTQSRKKQFEEAAVILRSAVKVFPSYSALWGTLGSMEFQLERWDAATKAFRETIRRSPLSEVASLGLFHASFKLGRERAAMNELKRFQSVSHSDAYERIVSKRRTRIPVAA